MITSICFWCISEVFYISFEFCLSFVEGFTLFTLHLVVVVQHSCDFVFNVHCDDIEFGEIKTIAYKINLDPALRIKREWCVFYCLSLNTTWKCLSLKLRLSIKCSGVFPVSKWEREHILVHTSAISVLKVYGH